jgi:glycosyltransferase involved in cell wall biosynthesis
MNILMILSNPFVQDPRVYNEALSLIKSGHKVTILAWDKKKENPHTGSIDGINIVRSYNSLFMKILPYDIFKMHFWWFKGYYDALDLHEKTPFDVVHCHDLDTLPIGVKLKKKIGLKLVYDAHELWGYMVSNDIPTSWANYYLNKEKKLIPYLDGFIIAEDKYADYFKTFTDKKLTSILNCKKIISEKYIQPKKGATFTLLFIGRLSSTRFLLELVESVKGLKKVKCIIGGIGKAKFVNKLKQKCDETKNVDFIGPVPLNEVIPMTQRADAVVCMINPNVINNKIATTNKQFEAMVCGRPVICTKGTRSGEITDNEKCGIVVDYSIDSLREGVIKLRDNSKLCVTLGKNALKAAIKKYNWDKQEEKLNKIYEQIT